MITSLILAAAAVSPQVIVDTDAYTWRGDTVVQGPFKAWAVSPEKIQSTYHGRPGYFMPVEQTWQRKNDLSSYPRLSTSNGLLKAVFNMGLDEMINAVEPDTTLRTGKEWAGVWTRDVSYSIILSMAALQPEASMISLMKKVNPEGQIIQDTGSGGAWPISTDRLVWALAAWEIYKVTGDRKWLEKVYPIVVRSIAKDRETVMSPRGLVKGETSFIDWREQSYPRWMQTADIAQSEAMNTNMVHAAALDIASQMARTLGKKKEAEAFAKEAQELARNINDTFWSDSMDDYAMYTYGRDNLTLNPRYETLGSSLAILYDIATPEQAASIVQHHPVTPFGSAIFYPQIADMPSYHNNALWPFVGSYWALANAKAGNEQGVLEAIGAVVRPAALFATNKENFNLDNGDYYTELNSSNMLWSLSGNLALTMKILFGINFEPDGIRFAPFVPKTLADTRSLDGVKYRNAMLDITVSGYGSQVKEITLNGKKLKAGETFIPASKLKGNCKIAITMADNDIPSMQVNRRPNIKAPLTPIARFEDNASALAWNPIEYIAKYVVLHNGEPVDTVRTTRYEISEPGEWQVIGVATDGTPSFASEPLYLGNYDTIQIPGEGTAMTSEEISYRGATPVAGYLGEGFAETDHNKRVIEIPVEITTPGTYSLSLRYANGNGPVNTENKAAIRALTLDGHKIGTVVLPQRGVANWDDWGFSNSVITQLPEGKHTLRIELLEEDENMNLKTNHALIDALILRPY